MHPAWPKDALRISFGVIWLIDAILKWLPGFRASYMSVIMTEAQGQPGWLKAWFDFWIRIQHPQAIFLAYLVAVLETLIAVALIAEMRRPAPAGTPEAASTIPAQTSPATAPDNIPAELRRTS